MVSALGTMMQRAGLLSEGQVASARELAQGRGVRLVDAILELELADEEVVVAFLHSRLMIPRVREAILDSLAAASAARISPELAWRHDVVPVSVDALGNLTLAMSDPTDVDAVGDVAQHTRNYIVRAVAPVGPLRRAIARLYGPPGPDPGATQPALPLLDDGPETARRSPNPPWNPPMSNAAQEAVPLSPEALAQVHPGIVAATDSDEVTRLLLDFLAAGFARVILFVHSREELRGKDCRGADLLPEAVRQVRIPSAGPSAFARAIADRKAHFGPMPLDTSIDQMFAQAMGGLSGNVLVLPLALGERVPLVVFAHGSSHAVDQRSIHGLGEAVELALRRILELKRKPGSPGARSAPRAP